MTEVDTSIYNKTAPAPLNVLDTFGQYQGIANAMQQNKLLQQELPILQQKTLQEQQQTKLAQGKQDAINALQDPKYSAGHGQFDFNSLVSDLAPKNPMAAMAALDMKTQYNKLTTGGYQNVNGTWQPTLTGEQQAATMGNPNAPQQPQPSPDQVDDAHDHLTHIQQGLNSLIKLPDSELNLDKVIESGVGSVQKHAQTGGKVGMGAAQVAATLAAPDFPREGPNGEPPSPQAIRQYLQGKFDQAAATQAHVTAKFGPPASVRNQQQPPAVANAPPSNGAIPAGPPAGFDAQQQASRQRIDQVHNEASSVPQQNAILEQIENLSKTAPTGQFIGKLYQTLAEKGITSKDVVDPAVQLQEIKKYMEQSALAGGIPASDARLAAVEGSNPNSDQLPQAIQALVPFLKATNQGKLAKQNYYDKTLGGSLDPNKETAAKSMWDNNYDPRLIELSALPKDQRSAYVASHPELKGLLPKYRNLKQMGVIGEGQ